MKPVPRAIQHVTYSPGRQPRVDVLVDEDWYAAVLLQWTQDENGAWTASVRCATGPGQAFHDVVPAEHVRGPARHLRCG